MMQKQVKIMKQLLEILRNESEMLPALAEMVVKICHAEEATLIGINFSLLLSMIS
jgi:predicted RNA methylase